MRINVKKNQDPLDTAFSLSNSLLDLSSVTSSSPVSLNQQNGLINSNRFVPIDILTVDKHSRITLTRNFRNAVSLNPQDKIIAYKDTYSRDIVLQFKKKTKRFHFGL